MNLFRSEEHVKRWGLYDPASEDFIMAVADWADVFSGPMHRNRLDPDYLERSGEYLAEYHRRLNERGKATSFWMIPFIQGLEAISLERYRVVGNYIRFEAEVLNALKDVRARIQAGLVQPGHRRENHLLWAPPGSGKTFFVQQVAEALGPSAAYAELNLARMDEGGFRAALAGWEADESARLVLIDEVDARSGERWPYEALLPYLDLGMEGGRPLVIVLAGSSAHSLDEMKRQMAERPKGKDVLSRVPGEHQAVIPAMTFGDRVLVMLSQFRQAGRELGREMRSVEKMALYYAAVNPRLANVRQLREFAVRAVDRVRPGDDRVKYDSLFEPGDPANKLFWLEAHEMARALVNSFVLVTD
ncbi:MAG TPA: AAA family ATPase [Anaerolineales bacterium]|nr:AAA family ATPase [Anaerolineales bacterium]